MSLRETIPLQKVKIIKKSLVSVIISACALAFLFLFSVSSCRLVLSPDYFMIGMRVLAGVLLIGVPVYQWLYFKRYFYDLNDQMLTIRKGVITQKEITLPFSRITDVYIDQDLLDVVFGLCDVHVSTPTAESGLFAHIDGVSKKGGEQLKALILEHVNKKAA